MEEETLNFLKSIAENQSVFYKPPVKVSAPAIIHGVGSVVDITAEDIELCESVRYASYNPCPIELKLKGMFPTKYCLVRTGYIWADKKYKTPESVVHFLDDWNERKPVKPFSFVLEEDFSVDI